MHDGNNNDKNESFLLLFLRKLSLNLFFLCLAIQKYVSRDDSFHYEWRPVMIQVTLHPKKG